MNRISCLLLSFLCTTTIPGQKNTKSPVIYTDIGYELSSPDKVYILPGSLREISGITEIDNSSIACVQDESGTVYIYDINNERIIRKFNFGTSGDYEDIARVNKSMYVVRSSEVLSEIRDYTADYLRVETYHTGIPGHDIEGLCYDKKNNRLLIAPKEIAQNDSDKKDKRYIYSFSLNSKTLTQGAAYKFDVGTIGKFAITNNIKVPMKEKKNGKKDEPDIKFRISAIGIHPLTNKLFIISGMENLIFVSDNNGNIEYIRKLDKEFFPQPEGITFLPNGDMFISNEGRNGPATLLRFKYKR